MAQGKTAPKGLQSNLITDMTAGLDRQRSPTLIGPTRSQQNRNVSLSVPGRWRPRMGWRTRSTTSLGSSRPQGGARVYLDGVTPFMLAAYAGSVYKPTDVSVWGSAVTTGFNTTNAIDFPFDADLVAVLDGVTTPKRSVDGTNWLRFGIAGPTAAGTVTAQAGGALTVAHTFELSYSYQGGINSFDSNESPTATAATAGANLTIRIVAAASADPQVAFINVYARDVTAGESVRRFAATIANPFVGTVTVNLTTNNWSSATEANTAHNPAPVLEFAQVWKGRWWGKDPSNPAGILFSELFLPQAWPLNYGVNLPLQRGDHITAIIPYGDLLIVTCTAKPAFMITGTSATDFDIRPIAAMEAGAFGFRSWAIANGAIVRAAAEGVYSFNGASDRLMTLDVDDDWHNIATVTTEANLARLPVVYHHDAREVRIAIPVIPLYGAPGEMVLDTTRSDPGKGLWAWSTTDRTVGGYMLWEGPETTTGNRGRLWTWGLTTGTLAEEDTGNSADGADLVATYRGPAFSTGLLVGRFNSVHGEYTPAEGTFVISVNVDGDEIVTKQVMTAISVPRFGTAIFGTDEFARHTRKMFLIDPLPLEAEGRAITIQATYSGQDVFDWFTYGLTYRLEPARRGIV